jgi:putative YhdH/YhfP family quinone oxidoreductase
VPGWKTIGVDALSPGEVLIKTAYSSVNFKDALAGTGKGKILRQYPLNGGIDVAGHVVASSDPAFKEGDAVLCTGSGLSETRDGGYGEYARLDARWTIPLPPGLSLRESMILGTAGFTVALGLLRMQDNRQTPSLGPIAVTGASGGVGMLAIDIFSRAGYEVHAISGKADHFDFLRGLGASECIDRHQLAFSGKPMDSTRFGGALDNVGGDDACRFAAVDRALRQRGDLRQCRRHRHSTAPSCRSLFAAQVCSVSPRPGPLAISATKSGSAWPATGNPSIWSASPHVKSVSTNYPMFSCGCWPASRLAVR